MLLLLLSLLSIIILIILISNIIILYHYTFNIKNRAFNIRYALINNQRLIIFNNITLIVYKTLIIRLMQCLKKHNTSLHICFELLLMTLLIMELKKLLNNRLLLYNLYLILTLLSILIYVTIGFMLSLLSKMFNNTQITCLGSFHWVMFYIIWNAYYIYIVKYNSI